MQRKQLTDVKEPWTGREALVYVVTSDEHDYVWYGCSEVKGKFGIVAFKSEAEANEYRDKIGGTSHVKHLPLSILVAAAAAKPAPCECVHVWYEGLLFTVDCKPRFRPIWCV